jgi:voltage-gated potassium channel
MSSGATPSEAVLDRMGGVARVAFLLRWPVRIAIAASIVAIVAGGADAPGWALALGWSAAAVFLADLALHLIRATADPVGRSPFILIDAAAALGFPVAMMAGLTPGDALLFGAVSMLKALREAPGIGLLGRVIREEKGVLGTLGVAFAIVLIGSATVLHLLERAEQPDAFGSMADSLWWAVVTLTTTGYGDEVPKTGAGRVVAGLVMASGITLFALLAGILAGGFFEELRRRDFLNNWDLVAKVPLFKDVGAGAISDVARLLKPRRFAAGQTIMRRGDPGDRMYFIVVGETEVRIDGPPIALGVGQFFGEIALVHGGPRTATVVARTASTLLVLDIADFRELCGRRPELTEAIARAATARRGE